jgi:hypothetical protein
MRIGECQLEANFARSITTIVASMAADSGEWQAAPGLIPIHGHRYLPTLPVEPGNPVLSVHQTDIICYGLNLEDDFANEYRCYFGRQGYALAAKPKTIDFWS